MLAAKGILLVGGYALGLGAEVLLLAENTVGAL